MLDGKRYYAAFPDENPEKPSLRALLHALERLEAQFCKHFKFGFRQSEPRQFEQTKKGRAMNGRSKKGVP
jgi:hypothetical protein